MKHYNEIAILLLALSQIFISIRLMLVERKVLLLRKIYNKFYLVEFDDAKVPNLENMCYNEEKEE